MKIIYTGQGGNSPFGKLVNGREYEVDDELGNELLRRGGFEKKKYISIGIEQQEFVEQAIKKTKKERSEEKW